MFTRCPECRTVFYITAAELRSADGMVICGACDTTFDALASLSETRPADTHAAEPAPAVETAAEGDDARDEEERLEERDADEFLREIESLIGTEDAPGGVPNKASDDTRDDDEPAFAVYADEVPDDDESVEHDEPMFSKPEDDALPDAFADPDSVFRVEETRDAAVDESVDEFDGPSTSPFVGDDDAQPASETAPGARLLNTPDEQDVEGAELDKAATGPIEPALRDEEDDAPDDAESVPGFVLERRRASPWPRILLALVALLVLAGTWAHVQRGKLLRLPAGEAILGPIYGLLGMEVTPDWRPGDFRVVRSEAIANADQPNDLQVAVEFTNSAAFDQPYPVIRIVLHDRFGQRIGTHDFAPGAYLDSYTRGARVPAGRKISASVSAPDPGARADGFRVDLCLEIDAQLVCSGEPFRQ
ncbi:MAG: zinc-ribbon and DUF3426 domain-containing protein [Gammaproteobacteria bacterium]